jgi:heme/copper-type cytochrome/quinol oxidase subunit 2
MTPEQGPPPGGWAPPPGTPPPGAPPGWTPPPAGYGHQQQGPARNGFGVAALVLGILALVTSIFGIGIIFGVAAVVFGVLGRKRAKRGEATNGGVALAGLLTGALALLVAVVAIAAIALLANNKDFKSFTDCANAARTQAERDACTQQFKSNFGQ